MTRPGRGPRLLHLAPDEKFIPFVEKVFETALPGCNVYRVLLEGGAPRHVKLSDRMRAADSRYFLAGELDADLARSSCLVIHYLTPWAARAIAAAPASLPILWGAWGGDFYHLLPGFARSLYLPETAAIAARLPVERPLRERLYVAAMRMRLPRIDARLLARVDFVSTVLPQEYALIADALPGFRARPHRLLYGSVEDMFAPGPGEPTGGDVLVGNSATPPNNHAEALQWVSRAALGERRVLVPLGYGSEAYADEVCRLGESLLGGQFVPLRRFLPLEEYNALLARCSVVVMNHRRQQGTGNIGTALYKGARVYLRPENPATRFYASIGIRTFDIAGEAPDAAFLEPLAAAEIERNRAVLRREYAFEAAVSAARAVANLRRAAVEA